MALVKIKRPAVISVVCVIGFLWMIFVLPGMFSPSVKKIGDWIPAIYGLILSFTFISFIGVWHMKKWGVEMYILSFFSKIIFFVLTNQVSFGTYFGMAFSIWFIITFMFFYTKMDRNL